MENFALKLDQYGCRDLSFHLAAFDFFFYVECLKLALCNFKQFFSLQITNFLGHASRGKKTRSLSIHLFCVHHLTYKILILSLRYLAYVCGLFFFFWVGLFCATHVTR